MKRIYLDWNATAPLDPRVLESMLPYLRGHGGNPSSLHADGRDARRAVEESRESFAELIRCEPREITFCSGATEANNLALFGVAAARAGTVAASAIEHPSVLEATELLRKRGRAVMLLPVTPGGALDLAAADRMLATPTAVCALMAANNETGVIQPVAALAARCQAAGAALHVDAVQALGKMAFDVAHTGITSASFSGHKIGGPKGAGVLFARAQCGLEPSIVGGGQERGRRAGTENVAAIIGFAAAARIVSAELAERRARLDALEQRFLAALNGKSLLFSRNGDAQAGARIPGTLNLRFAGISGEGLLFGLDILGVSVSLGSACSSGAAQPSHVLEAMGVPKVENLQSVRFSFGPNQTELDVDNSVAAIEKVLQRSRTSE